MEKEVKKNSFIVRAFARFIKYSLVVSAILIISYYVNQIRLVAIAKAELLKSQAIDVVTLKQKVFVQADKIPIDDLIRISSEEHRIPAIALKAIVFHESAGGSDQWLYRFEPSVYERRREIDAKYSEDERRMRSSSHGITQIMGYNAEARCGVHWSKLYDPAIAIDCAAKILSEELESHRRIEDPIDRLREALRSYNGSGSMAERYADRAMATIGELLLRQATDTILSNDRRNLSTMQSSGLQKTQAGRG